MDKKLPAPIIIEGKAKRIITIKEIHASLNRVAEGISLKAACQEQNLPYMTVYHRIEDDKDLKELHARAKQMHYETKVSEMNEIALNEPDTQRARLICDNIKWAAARVCKNVYGDHAKIEHSGDITLRDLVLGSMKIKKED